MKKIHFTLFLLALLVPCMVSSQTVHTVSDTSFNADQSIAYYIDATVVSEAGKNTITFTFSEGTSSFGEVFDLNIFRDVDARYKDRTRIAKQVQLPANGTFVFVDEHEEWIDDGGGDYGYTGSGVLPANTPFFYSITINRLEEFGGTARPRRSYPAIFLPEEPTDVIVDPINDDMTLVTQVFPNSEDTSVILKMDFAPNYDYYQRVLLEATPGEPLYPAGDRLVFFGRVLLNNMADPDGRTNIEYGNIYWGYEGSAYAKFKVAPEFLDDDKIAYAWFNSGRPGHASVLPVPIRFELEDDPGTGGADPTVHTSIDTCFNSDLTAAYYLSTTVVSEPGKNTVTFTLTGANSSLGEVFDLNIYRDVDARYRDRTRIAKGVQLPANGTFVFVDEHADWIDDGGGDYGYTGSGELPANTPFFYSLVVSRQEAFGGPARPRRSTPAIYLPDLPTDVITDMINDDMTLITQVFPNAEDTSVILKMDFAPNYDYYQRVLLEATPGEPLYPAGDRLVFYGRVFLNDMADPAGRTNIEYGNIYWGNEGSTYAKFKVAPEFLDENATAYAWFNSGRPGHASVVPVPIRFDLEIDPGGGGGDGGEPTVHTSVDTCFNSDLTVAYYLNTTVVSEPGKNTVTFTLTEGNSSLGEVFDLNIYRDVDARYRDRARIARGVQLPANGTFVFVDRHAEWINDGGGDFGYTGSGELPANTPFFYSLVVSRLEAFGGPARPRRSTPAIHLPDLPTDVVTDMINDDMTLITQVFPNTEDSTVILKLDFAPNYDYYQRVLLEASPDEPLYPAGDRLVFYGRVFLNSVPDPDGRTNIEYGNLYWGNEGSTYAKFKVAPEFLEGDGIAYAWFNSGRPGHASVIPIPINLSGTVSNTDLEIAPLELSVYPNPTSGLLNIKTSESIDLMNVYNLNGQLVHSRTVNGEVAYSSEIDLSNMPSGIYFLQVKTRNYLLTKKIILK